jgi:propionyl-CoA carboxylase alpha chain
MFKKILIANRGEIACRVIKTARKMGIKTVAVYSEADKDAMHVSWPTRPSASARRLEGVLPGRWTRSSPPASRPAPRPCTRATASCPRTRTSRAGWKRKASSSSGRSTTHRAMGDKIASKKLALEAKVNTIPGYNDAIDTPEQAVEIAKGIGYPVMIKASAGGGGKGLRVAFNDKEAHEGFASCKQRGKERLRRRPRLHREVRRGAAPHRDPGAGRRARQHVYLHERECSIQRRHQKVIEEAPSPFLDPRRARPWASRPWRWPRGELPVGRHGRVRRRRRDQGASTSSR